MNEIPVTIALTGQRNCFIQASDDLRRQIDLSLGRSTSGQQHEVDVVLLQGQDSTQSPTFLSIAPPSSAAAGSMSSSGEIGLNSHFSGNMGIRADQLAVLSAHRAPVPTAKRVWVEPVYEDDWELLVSLLGHDVR